MLVDLNDFKSINDRWGHAAGDTALCAAAQRLQDALRANDRIGRMGGDEFAIVLFSDTSLRVGLSLGIASAEADAPFEGVLARADAAMYEDKRRQKLASDLLG